ncbi:DUF418 domain-containing protein [Cellulophaga sp. F20128]|uniref:DUF418 domain-containing protein n=1 Tax=Cellulophaga sp. F20128 TaxID=2926413 RepID=UPI001FF4AE25|nr:DUF418 domain-containing protein [Cellulophaga sp. F20128]MCK0155780.1 DUF418 domain-containing protein [Cellulophaga sp. F20128]
MQSTTNQTKPVAPNQRIEYLDVLRGIAIFFIFCANIVYFSGYFDFPVELRTGPTFFKIDDYFEFVMHMLVDGKFYSIFSLLFGIGCAIQLQNITSQNKHFTSFFRRRMLWLLGFGLLHLVFLWMGDILTLYALLGLVLILFVQCTDKQLLQWAVILILLPLLNWGVIHLLGFNYPSFFYNLNPQFNAYVGVPNSTDYGILLTDFNAYLRNENLLDFFKANMGATFIRIGDILNEGRAFKVLGIFLLGLWAGRKILNENLLENRAFLKKIAIWGLCIGLPISCSRSFIVFFLDSSDFWSFMSTLSYAFGTVPLAIAYTAILALVFKKEGRFLHWFAPVGKMALSNYLMQTIVATIVFYGIGFKLAGSLGYTLVIGSGLLIFSAQVIFSRWWLKRFTFGPMEWLWRQLTYGKRITNKR